MFSIQIRFSNCAAPAKRFGLMNMPMNMCAAFAKILKNRKTCNAAYFANGDADCACSCLSAS